MVIQCNGDFVTMPDDGRYPFSEFVASLAVDEFYRSGTLPEGVAEQFGSLH